MRTSRRAADGTEPLSPQAFYNAAFKILGEAGHEGLTVDSLCARLEVTKGSFYHHFANTTEFIAGLLRAWETTIEGYFQIAEDMRDDPARLLEVMWTLGGVNRPHEAEAALHSWANANPIVAATVRRVDQKIETVSREWLQRYHGPERGRVIAFMWTSMLGGMQQRPQPLDHELILAATLEFLRTNMGVEAEIDGEQLRVLKMPAPATARGD